MKKTGPIGPVSRVDDGAEEGTRTPDPLITDCWRVDHRGLLTLSVTLERPQKATGCCHWMSSPKTRDISNETPVQFRRQCDGADDLSELHARTGLRIQCVRERGHTRTVARVGVRGEGERVAGFLLLSCWNLG
jgi:hypothetical protein